MSLFFDRPDFGERALLVHLKLNSESEPEDVGEFEELVRSAGGDIVDLVRGSRTSPHAKFFIGTGKLEEITEIAKRESAQLIIFNHNLSPSQERNLEAHLQCRVLDRTGLILDIFAMRARTHEGKLQVELAQLQHLSSRLVRGWTHLERQKGGIGMRGPGETQLESDRRMVRDRIKSIKKRLEKVRVQRDQGRQSRLKSDTPTVSLVGYTNVGKSTLMNVVSKSEVFAENKLFATLDTTVRKVVVKNIPFLMTDTVGFIRKLPTQLVESFKSTLDEVREADLLLHVVDISHKNFEDHIESVNKILQEIESSGKPSMMIFNKIDAYTHETIDEDDLVMEKTKAHFTLEELQKTWMSKMENNCVFISALNKENLDDFKNRVYEEVKKIHIKRFPYNNFLYNEYTEES